MTSKNFSSKGLLGDSLRRNLWGFVLGGVGFFLSLLLPLLMTMQRALENRTLQLKEFPNLVDQDWQSALGTVAELLGGGNFLAKAVLAVMAIVCGVVMFAYLHSRQKVDFYHSLPISRTGLFANNFLTGIVLSILPYLVVLVLSVACVYGMGFGEAVQWASLGSALVSHLIMFLTLYALTVLTTIVCGNTVITLLLLAWVHLSPMLAQMLFSGLCSKFYSSYAMVSEHMQQALRLSPVVELFEINGFSYASGGVTSVVTGKGAPGSATGLLLVYLAVAIVATALALWLFRIRRSERAGVALAFTRAKLPVKVYMCLFMGVAFGIVFGMIAGNFWFWAGLVIGTVLTHWVVEIVYAFDFRAIFGKPLHLVVILAVLFAAMLCMRFDVTGYDTWLPARDRIQAVSIDGDESEMLSEAANIDAAYQLGEIGVQVNRDALRKEGTYHSVRLTFQLGSRTESRNYMVPENDAEVNALLNQIYSSAEYKQVVWPLFQVDLNEKAIYLDVYSNASGYSVAGSTADEDAVRQIITTLREESLARKENGLPVLRLEMLNLDREEFPSYLGDAYVTAEDEKTLALLEQLTGIKPTALTTENVKLINLQYNYQYGDSNNYYTETVPVTDPADIAALLKNACNRDAMTLGGLRSAIKDGFAFDARTDDMEIVACVDQDGVEDYFQLVYEEGAWPESIVEKYRPDFTSISEIGATGEMDGSVDTEALG